MSVIAAASVSASGRFSPPKPTLSYLGSGTNNMGKFQITNYSSSYIYTHSGATRTADTLTVTNPTASVTLTAINQKGISASTSTIVERLAPAQSYYFVSTGPFECHGCGGGPEAPCCAPGPCGCGTFHEAGAFPYRGFWACCEPGYNQYYWINYGSSGYTWGGSDYTNGSGEWWKIT